MDIEEKDRVVEQVKAMFDKRSQLGIKKYGTTLDKNKLPLKEWLQHSLEEQMDNILYLQRSINELD